MTRKSVPTQLGCFVCLVILFSCATVILANQVYKWKTIEFKDLTRDVDTIVDGENVYYNEESVLMTGFDYDTETGYICAAFPRNKPSVPVTVGCFSADEYEKFDTPKFSAFPTVADNDLPDWPEAKLPLGDQSSPRFYNYRQSRGRKNFTAYYLVDGSAEVEDQEDSQWVRGRDFAYPSSRHPGKNKAFSGFSGLGNLLIRKDKKDVVVAVVDDSGNKKKPSFQWSSEENRWSPDGKPIGTVIVGSDSDEKPQKNRFFQFFDKIGNQFNSIFNRQRGEQKPIYHVNLEHSSEEDHHDYQRPQYHYQPTTFVAPAWYSSEEEDDRWHLRPQKKKKKTNYHNYDRDQEIPLYYDPEDYQYQHDRMRYGGYNKNPYLYEERNLHSDLGSEPISEALNEKKEQLSSLLIKNGEGEEEEPAVPVQIAVPMKGSEEKGQGMEKEPEPVKLPGEPIKIPRPYNFISVHNVKFDKCGRLWFIDVGTVEYSTNPIFYRNPILWAFEVKTGAKGKLISRPYLRHELEDSTPTGLRSLVVDIHEECDDFHVYMPNSKDNRIVVYSSEKNEHWQFEHPSLAPVLKEVETKVQDFSYKFTAGVYSLTMGTKDDEGYRDVYYSVGSGTGQFKVNTDLLRDDRAAPNRFNPKLFKFVGYRGVEGLTRSQVFDPRTEVLFTASIAKQEIKCWNSNKLLTPDNFGTAFSHEDMVFGYDVKIDRKGNLWSLANKYQMILTNGMNVNEENFSIFRMKPKEIIKGSVCAMNNRRNRALKAVSPLLVSDEDKRFDAVEIKQVEVPVNPLVVSVGKDGEKVVA